MDITRPRTALVTGASAGLGLALARTLAADGWRLVITARGRAALATAQAQLALRTPTTMVVGDVADPAHREAVADAVAETVGEAGHLDLVVNNASDLGPSPLPHLLDLDPDRLTSLLATNAVAPLALVQAVRPWLAEAAAVVNVTSDAAHGAWAGWGGYGASKAALEQLTAVLGVEQPGWRVWAVDPGDLRTAMHQAAFPGEDISDRPLPDDVAPLIRTLLERRPPSGRMVLDDLRATAGVRA